MDTEEEREEEEGGGAFGFMLTAEELNGVFLGPAKKDSYCYRRRCETTFVYL